jgi:hypothetical protein
MVAASNRPPRSASPGSRPALRFLRGRGPKRDSERPKAAFDDKERRAQSSPETESQLQHVFAREEEARSRAEARVAGGATAQPPASKPDRTAQAARRERQPMTDAATISEPAGAASANHQEGKPDERC